MDGPSIGVRPAYDAIVVGARCAGAATAMLLARAGAEVLLVDQAARGTDTVSTLALMRGAVLQLGRWGLLDGIRAAGTPRVERTTFHYANQAIEIAIKPRDGVDALYAPRRTVLDPLLADAARAAGADVAYGVRFKELTRDGRGRVNGAMLEDAGRRLHTVSANLVIGADGVGSTVAKRAGAMAYRLGAHASAVIYTFSTALDIDGYHWHFVPGFSAGVIPTGGHVLVFASMPRERFVQSLRDDLAGGFYATLTSAAPRLAAALRCAPPAVPFRGFAGHRGFFRQAWGPGWALVGDAGYFKDPLTAHGITDALRDATILAGAVTKGTDEALAQYQATRDELSHGLFEITDEIASFEWDVPRVQALHKSMSDEMAREVAYLRDVEAAPPVAPPVTLHPAAAPA